MKKSDGTYTYFVPDVAYHLNKFSRGYTKAVNIQGTDHHGTIARVRAGLQAASKTLGVTIPKTFPEYILHKMLSVVKGGEVVKMSKRSGNYVTLRDLVDWAGRDAARFFLVSRKADAEFVFDVDLAKKTVTKIPSTICSTPMRASVPFLPTLLSRATKFRTVKRSPQWISPP